MKTTNDYKPVAQLLTEWSPKNSGAQNDDDTNDLPVEKSRWTKWKLQDENNADSVSYCRMEKSESTLLGRLADRLNYWAGNARCAARNKIIQALMNQGITISEDIRKALPDRWKLGNTKKLESSIKAAVETRNKKIVEEAGTSIKMTAEREAKEKALKNYCQSELAEPFRQYMWGVANGEVTSAGVPLTVQYKSLEEKITEKIAKVLEPRLHSFIDSLFTSLSEQKKPLSAEIIDKFTKTHFSNFLLSAFFTPEAKAIEAQISSAHEIAEKGLKVQNGKFRRTGMMPRLNPIISDKLIEKVIKQRTENIFEQRALGNSLLVLEEVSDTLGTDECTRVFCLISEALTRQLNQIETIRREQRILLNN